MRFVNSLVGTALLLLSLPAAGTDVRVVMATSEGDIEIELYVDRAPVTAGNFLRAVPITLVLSVAMIRFNAVDMAGFCYAVASGALASGLGYAIWYTVLPALKNTSAGRLPSPTRSRPLRTTFPAQRMPLGRDSVWHL